MTQREREKELVKWQYQISKRKMEEKEEATNRWKENESTTFRERGDFNRVTLS